MDIGMLSLEEMKQGYRFDPEKQVYSCNYCGQHFPRGQVFLLEESYYEPEPAAAHHVALEHGGNFNQLIDLEDKYNTLTEVQKKLLALFHFGLSDKEIAQEMGVSASTVRHQKFTFREKAKRARRYLALYELALGENEEDENSIVPIHSTATMVDSRYVTTHKERDKILKASFLSLEPLRLKEFPFKPKKHVVVLTRISEEFEQGKEYSDIEMREILEPIYEDYSLLRRLLVDYGFMDRTKDGKKYWVK